MSVTVPRVAGRCQRENLMSAQSGDNVTRRVTRYALVGHGFPAMTCRRDVSPPCGRPLGGATIVTLCTPFSPGCEPLDRVLTR